MNHCQCTQKIGLHHNPVCKLHGVVSLDNIIPPDKSPLRRPMLDRLPTTVAKGFVESKRTGNKRIAVTFEPADFDKLVKYAQDNRLTTSAAIRRMTLEGMKLHGL